MADAWIVCSETCALDLIGATYVRDVEPGEVLVITDGGLRSIKPFPPQPLSHCVFEHVYFARPDSYVFGRSVNEVRTELGRMLAREAAVDADVVVPIPDSGVCAAIGFAEEAGLPMKMGLIRNHYVGRTFIEPQQSIRHFSVKVKLNPVRSILEGRRVILVDDSIVRGTTSRKIVKMVRAAGAKEVHLRISCPPTISPCFYGVDTPNRSELIAATHSLEDIRKYVAADSPRLSEPRRPAPRRRRASELTTARRATPACIRSRFRATSRRTSSSRSRRSTDAMRAPVAAVLLLTVCAGLSAQQPPARPPATPAPPPAPSAPAAGPPREGADAVTPAQLAAAIEKLGTVDFAERMAAARTTRRADPPIAVPALIKAVESHPDGYVRFRALVLLSGFNDPRTQEVMRGALAGQERSPPRGRVHLFRAQPRSDRCPAAARRRRRRVRPSSSGRR